MFENEEWREIEEFPQYLISDYGRVKHVDRIEARRVEANERGFLVILLSSNNTSTRYMRQINNLVAHAFLPSPEYDYQTGDKQSNVWHIDGDLTNCRADNLRWETRGHVLEWNDMHRTLEPKYHTAKVKNNRTGDIYDNAYVCAMSEGVVESLIVSRIERNVSGLDDDNARYRYVY